MRRALRAEVVKLARSPVGIVAALAYVGGLTALCAVIVGISRSGDRDLIAKLGPSIAFDWMGLLNAAAQITGAGGFIASGVVVAWVFAREFADGTVTGLLALPVSRSDIALAKTIAFLLWVVSVSVGAALALLLTGLAFGFGVPSPDEGQALARQVALSVLTGIAVLPVAWVASGTRSLLASVGAAIGLVVAAQIGVLSGAGAWMPLAAPTLWALSSGAAVTPAQLGLTVLVGIISVAGTVAVWRGLQLDR